jgi:hypothetical protein
MSHDDLQGTPVKAMNIYREVLMYTNIRFENTAATNRNKYTPILSHILCELPVHESWFLFGTSSPYYSALKNVECIYTMD